MRLLSAFLSLALIFAPFSVYAHSGGTDANGCHTDSSTGTRHCHNSGGFIGDAPESEQGSNSGKAVVTTVMILGGIGLAGGGLGMAISPGASDTTKAVGIGMLIACIALFASWAIFVVDWSEEETPTAGVTLLSW